MYFILVLSLGLFMGFKLCKAITLVKETRNINYIKSVVEVILSNKEIEFVDLKRKDVEADPEEVPDKKRRLIKYMGGAR